MNNRIVVLGGGESGVGAAVLAKVKGFDVFLSDKGKIEDRYVKMLDPVGKAFYFFLRASFFQYNDHDIFSPWK